MSLTWRHRVSGQTPVNEMANCHFARPSHWIMGFPSGKSYRDAEQAARKKELLYSCLTSFDRHNASRNLFESKRRSTILIEQQMQRTEECWILQGLEINHRIICQV